MDQNQETLYRSRGRDLIDSGCFLRLMLTNKQSVVDKTIQVKPSRPEESRSSKYFGISIDHPSQNVHGERKDSETRGCLTIKSTNCPRVRFQDHCHPNVPLRIRRRCPCESIARIIVTQFHFQRPTCPWFLRGGSFQGYSHQWGWTDLIQCQSNPANP